MSGLRRSVRGRENAGVEGNARRALVLVALLGVLVAACQSPSADRFDRVRAIAQQLRIEQSGRVVDRGEFGKGGFSQQAPSLLIVLRGRDATSNVLERLRGSDFERITDERWTRADEDVVDVVLVQPLSAGDVYTDARGKDVKAASTGVAVTVTSG